METAVLKQWEIRCHDSMDPLTVGLELDDSDDSDSDASELSTAVTCLFLVYVGLSAPGHLLCRPLGTLGFRSTC